MQRNSSRCLASNKATSASRLRDGRCTGWHSTLEQQKPCSWSCGSASQVSVSRPTVSSPAPPSSLFAHLPAANTSATPGVSNASVAGRSHDNSGRQSSSQVAGSQSRMKTVRSVCFPMPGAVALYRSPSLSADIDAWNRSHFVEDGGVGLQNAGGVLLPSISAQDAWSRALQEERLRDCRSSTGSIEMYGASQATSIGIKPITIEPTHIKSPEPMNTLNRPLEFRPFLESSLNAVNSNALELVPSVRALRTSDMLPTKQPSSTSPERSLQQLGQLSPSGRRLGSGTILPGSFSRISQHPFETLRQGTPMLSQKSPSNLARPSSPVSVGQGSKNTSQSRLPVASSREIQPCAYASMTSQSLLQQQGKLRRGTLPQLSPAPQITSLEYAARRAGSLQSIYAPRKIEVSSIKTSLTGITTPLSCTKNVSSASLAGSAAEAKTASPMKMERNLSTRAINVSRKKQGSAQSLKQHSSSLTVLDAHPPEASAVPAHRSHSQQINSTDTIVPKN